MGTFDRFSSPLGPVPACPDDTIIGEDRELAGCRKFKLGNRNLWIVLLLVNLLQ
jgi:hypothetical protein